MPSSISNHQTDMSHQVALRLGDRKVVEVDLFPPNPSQKVSHSGMWPSSFLGKRKRRLSINGDLERETNNNEKTLVRKQYLLTIFIKKLILLSVYQVQHFPSHCCTFFLCCSYKMVCTPWPCYSEVRAWEINFLLVWKVKVMQKRFEINEGETKKGSFKF